MLGLTDRLASGSEQRECKVSKLHLMAAIRLIFIMLHANK